MSRIAKLALKEGMVFTGTAFGAEGEVFGEVVFNTSMTGVPRDSHRPFLLWPNRYDDLPTNWELWCQSRRC